MTSLAAMSISDLSAGIRSREIGPLDLLDACDARVSDYEPTIRAFVTYDVEAARRASQTLTQELQNGRWRGPLHGIPIAVKDMVDVRGWQTRAGSNVLAATAPASSDSPAVARLRRAGAVIVGKTTTHEFAYGMETPPTRNPWDLDRVPGGSSGGSAAAVAYGGAIAALGTDSGGSVRIPAALCSISGLRPRRGVLPTAGSIPLSAIHDTIGPMARTAADLELLWSVLADGDYQSATRSPVRLGVLQPLDNTVDASPEVAAAYEAAVHALAADGCEIVPVHPPRFSDWDAPRSRVVLSDVLAEHTLRGWYPEREHLYGSDLREYLRKATTISGSDLVLAMRRLNELGDALMQVFDNVDVLALPTTSIVAPRVDEMSVDHHSERLGPLPIVSRLLQTCAPISWCGLAAVSVPCGFSDSGLPIGLQLVAKDETTVLASAKRFQEATAHHLQQPNIRIPAAEDA